MSASGKPRSPDLAELSDLIGAIYECALDPGHWTSVLERICIAIEGNTSALYLIDLAEGAPRLFSQWGAPDSAVEAWKGEFAREVSSLHATIAGRLDGDPHEPNVYSRLFSDDERAQNRVNQEWAIPLGICDVIGVPIMTAPMRLGMLVSTRHHDVGLITEREIAVMRLLAPHIQKAVTISDLLDMRLMTRSKLQATLDAVGVAIVIVGSDLQILHANVAGHELLRSGRHLISSAGRLGVADQVAAASLAHAVAGTERRGHHSFSSCVSTVAVPGAGAAPLIAHVLPLDPPSVGTRLIRQPMAVVIATLESDVGTAAIDGWAASCGLTKAETRLLGPVGRGLGIESTAAELGVSANTIKSQLNQIYKKLGVTRQAELAALVSRLSVPIRGIITADQ